jgi:arginase
MKSKYSIIEAPLFVGAGLKGTELLPKALLKAGLAKMIGARIAKGPGAMTFSTMVDGTTHALDYAPVEEYCSRLADSVARELEVGRFPIVLGGDCTVLIGCAAACQRQNVDGLLFLDAHSDFSDPGNPDYETASADLYIVSGQGSLSLGNLNGRGTYFKPDNISVFGLRDDEIVEKHGGGDVRAAGIYVRSIDDLLMHGFSNCVFQSLERFVARSQRFWIHLDLDVLDDAVISAVDYRIPGGLSVGEVCEVIRRARATDLAAGLNVTILNPSLDWDGTQVKLVAKMLGSALR